MLIRVVVAAVLAVGSLAACERGTREPHPTTTLEPSITESSVIPTVAPDNRACSLLSKAERQAVPGYSMNDTVPVIQDPGTSECVWIHSRRQYVKSAIRVIALSAREWAPTAVDTVTRAMISPRTDPASVPKLKRARAELLRGALKLPPERICEIYLLGYSVQGFDRTSDLTAYGRIGALPAAFAVSCDNGILVIAGYGELGLRPSLAVQHAVAKLAALAAERAPKYFEASTADSTDGAATEPSADASEQPSPRPSASSSSDSDSDSS